MSEASLIINVSNREQLHSNGLSGTWIVPAKTPSEKFALLVVYPTHEIQDIGDQRRVSHWLKARPLAKDIVGLNTDAAAHSMGVKGSKEKWGLLLCEAEPDLPKLLTNAIEEEIVYLNRNPPDVKYRRDPDSKANVATNVEPVEVSERKIKLSHQVQRLRAEFESECRRLVQKSEILLATKNMQDECQRLVAEGDRMWAREPERPNISELHRWGCELLGQERPWCYVPQQLIDCPGCGAKIKENILTCPNCSGWLDEGIDVLLRMSPKDRAMKMYPERYMEPTGGKVK